MGLGFKVPKSCMNLSAVCPGSSDATVYHTKPMRGFQYQQRVHEEKSDEREAGCIEGLIGIILAVPDEQFIISVIYNPKDQLSQALGKGLGF